MLEEIKIETRGRKATCRKCKFKFKIQKEDKKAWADDSRKCPACGEYFCDLPETDKQLMILQNAYYDSDKSKSIFDQMILIFYDYAEGKILQSHSSVLTYDGALEYYTQNAVSLFLEYYLKNPEFRVTDSFGGLINKKILQSCYGKKEYDPAMKNGLSMDYTMEDGSKVEYADLRKTVSEEIEEDDHRNILVQTILSYIFGIEEYCNSTDNFIRLINLLSYLEGNDTYFDKFFQSYGKDGKEITLATLYFLRRRLEKDMIFE